MKIRKCLLCSLYTLKDVCPRCGVKVYGVKPPKFSPQDAYGIYRRMLKKSQQMI